MDVNTELLNELLQKELKSRKKAIRLEAKKQADSYLGSQQFKKDIRVAIRSNIRTFLFEDSDNAWMPWRQIEQEVSKLVLKGFKK